MERVDGRIEGRGCFYTSFRVHCYHLPRVKNKQRPKVGSRLLNECLVTEYLLKEDLLREDILKEDLVREYLLKEHLKEDLRETF